jgi:outer membrane protein assembly factor BamB
MPTQRWTSAAATKPGAPAIDASGTIYVANGQNLWALHADGTPAWNYPVPQGEASLTPNPTVGSDGTVYIGAGGAFLAIAANGTLKWKITLPVGSFGAEYGSAPVIDSAGTIYFYSSDGAVHALNPDGSQKWTLALPPAGLVIISPSLGADGVLHISDGHTIYAVNSRGELGWTATFRGNADDPVVGTNGLLYFFEKGLGGASPEMLHAYHANGTEAWSYPVNAGIRSRSPAIGADGTIYFAGIDGLLYALDSRGVKKWTSALPSRAGLGIIVGGDGSIYVPTDTSVVAFDPSGVQRWTYAVVGANALALGGDGSLVVAAQQLVALSR